MLMLALSEQAEGGELVQNMRDTRILVHVLRTIHVVTLNTKALISHSLYTDSYVRVIVYDSYLHTT